MRCLFIACLIAVWAVPTSAQSLDEIRLLYRDATESQAASEAFYEKVKDFSQDSKPVFSAYKGAGLMLLARYTKLSERGTKVREAAAWIENAIARAPKQTELRLIRLSVQEHLPKIVRYNQHLEEDRAFIQDALPSVDDDVLHAMITHYFEKYSK